MAVIIPGIERQTRRVKVLYVETSVFFLMLKGLDGSRLLMQSGIPEDAKVTHTDFNQFYDRVEMLIESETFPAVPEGTLPEELMVNFVQYTGFSWPEHLRP